MLVGFLFALIAVCWMDATVHAADLSEIRARGYLIVGVKDNLRPLGFKDSQGQLQGFEIEIARQLATELLGDPAAVEFKPLLNQDRLTALLDDQVDIVVARMTNTDARTRLVEFSQPYYVDGAALITRDPVIQSWKDLQQQAVAVLLGSDTIPTIQLLLPAAQLRGVESYDEAKALLDAGEVAAFAADGTLLAGWVQENPAYRGISPLLSAEVLAIAMPKGRQYKELRQQINQAIDRWQTDGWLRQRIADWDLPADGFPSFPDLPR